MALIRPIVAVKDYSVTYRADRVSGGASLVLATWVARRMMIQEIGIDKT